jgi:hypothetical protein
MANPRPAPSSIRTPHSALRNRLALLAAALLALLPGPAPADPPGKADPLPLRRILIPAARVPAELERMRQGVLVKMPREEFEALVQRAARAGQRAANPPRLTRAAYTARLEKNALVGSGDWTIHNPGDRPGVLALPDFNLPLSKANFDDASVAVLGDLDGKALGLLVGRAGKQALFFDWSLRGRVAGGDLHFDVQVPPCPVASLELKLPADHTLTTSRTGALLSGPDDAGDPRWRTWRVQFSGRSRLDLVVRRPDTPGRPPTLVLAQLQSAQQLVPQHQLARYEFQVEVLHGSLRQLVFDLDATLEPYEVTVARGELQGWELERRPPGKSGLRALTVRLREPFQGGLQPLRVTVQCLAPLRCGKGGRAWESPGMNLRGAFSQTETLKLQIHPDVRLEDWQPGRFRLTRTAPTADGGRVLTLVDGEVARPGPRPTAAVRTHGVDFLARQLVWWHVGPAGSSLTAEVTCTVTRGGLLKLPVRVAGDWQVQEVRVEPRELFANWVPAGTKGNALVLVDLQRGVTTGESVKLTVRLRSAQGARAPQGGLVLPFPDLEVLGASLREGTLAVGLDPSYQGTVAQASAPPGAPEGEGPWGRTTPNFAYLFRGQPISGRLRVVPQRPRLAARVSAEVQLGPGRAGLSARLLLEPVVGSPEAVDLWLSAPAAGPWKWSAESSPGLVRGLRRQPGLEVAPRLLAFATPHPVSAAAAFAAPHGQRWRLLLARPLTRRESVTLETTLDGHATGPDARERRWDLPLLSVPGADSMDGELAVALGAAELREVRAVAVREAGRGGAGPADRPEGWRVFGYGPALFPERLPALSVRVRAADPDRPPPAAAGGREACDRSRLTTYVEPDGRLLHYFRFRVWNWRRPEGGRRDLPVWLPEGVRLLAARVEGLWLERVEQHETPGGLRVELPVPAGPQPHQFELVYASPGSGPWWSPWSALHAPPPRLPVPATSLRRTWRLPPGVVPLGQDVRRLPDSLGPSDREPWWEPVRRVWQTGRSWLSAIGPEFAPDPWATAQRQQLNEAEQALRRQHPGGAPWRLGETLERLVSGPQRSRGALVVDTAALREAGLGPDTPFTPDEAPTDDRPVSLLSPLGLVYLPCRAAALLTTRRQRELWKAAAGEVSPVSGAIEQAVSEAAAHGRDASGRFQTVAHWLGSHPSGAGDAEGLTPSGPVPTLDSDRFGASWTEWEALPGGGAGDGLLVVRQTGVRALGLILAALFGLLVWRGGRALGRRWGFRLLMVWLAGTSLAVFWLPPALRDAAWWPALAGAAVALLWYARSGPAPGKKGRPAPGLTDKLARAGSSAAVVVLLLALATPAQIPLGGPEPYPVLILPGPPETPARQSVLVGPDLLKKLDELTRRGQPSARSVVLAAEYTGQVVGERAEFTAEFQVYCPTAEATLVLPLGGVDLKEGSLWAGARVYPAALPAPQTGYEVPIRKSGTTVNTLRLAFSVRLPPGSDVRELRFSVPRVPRSRLVLTLPQGAQAAQAVSAGGAQTQLSAAAGPRLEADLGREGNVLVRWRAKPRVLRPPSLEVRETYLWDLRQPGGALTAVLQYTVTSGAAEYLPLALPEGVAVRSVDVAQVGAPPEGAAAARLRGWRLQGKGPGRQLLIDLLAPAAGEVQVTLGLLPRLAVVPGTLKLHLPTPLGVARPGEGLLAYAVEGYEPSARAPDLTVAKAEPEVFAQAWQRLGLRDPVRPTRAYSFRRRQGSATLELNLLPLPREAQQEIRWRVARRHADFELTLTLTAPCEDLALVEWGVPGVVTVAEVTGPQVDSWSARGGRLQVWLRQPVKETATVRVELRGWVLHPRPQPGQPDTFALPCLRLLSALPSVNLVRVSASPGLDLTPGPEGAFQDLQRLPEREPAGPLSYRAMQPSYRGELLLRPSPVTATVRTLILVEARPGGVTFTGLLEFDVPHGELRSAAVRLRGWEGDAVRLEAPGAARVEEKRGPRGGWTWTIALPPGVTRRYAVRVSGTLPLKEGGKLALPELSAPGAGAGPRWLAVLGRGLRPEAASGLVPVKDVPAELAAWPAEARRTYKEGTVWRIVKDGSALRLEARPAGEAAVRVLYADLEAAATDLRGWVHQATYWLYAGSGAEPRLTLPRGARLLATAVDGVPVVARRQESGTLAVPLPGGEGPHELRLRWAFEAGTEPLGAPRLDAPRFKDLAEPSVVWRVDVPPGSRLARPRRAADPTRPVGPAAAELAKAEGQLRLGVLLAERLRAGPSEVAAVQLAVAHRQCVAHCRQAANLLASTGGQGAGPGGKALGEWLQDLRQQNARLGRVTGAEKLPAVRIEGAPAFFYLPERGLPSYWYGSDPGQAPAVALVALAEDRWRESASATELLLIALAAVWVLAYLPRAQRWLWWLLPEQVVLLGWLGTQSFGLSPLGVVLILGGVCARLGIVCVWIQNRLRGARPDEPPTASSFHSA